MLVESCKNLFDLCTVKWLNLRVCLIQCKGGDGGILKSPQLPSNKVLDPSYGHKNGNSGVAMGNSKRPDAVQLLQLL